MSAPPDPLPQRNWPRTAALAALTVVAVVACVCLVYPFLAGLTWGIALAVVALPLQRWLDRRLKPGNLTAAITTTLVVLLIGVPVGLVGWQLTAEAKRAADEVQAMTSEQASAVSSIRSAGGNATIVMTLGDLSELYVDGEVDEVDVGKIISEQRIRPDLEARVSIESFKDRIFPGRVTRIAPLGLEDRNGIVTFEVRIVLENPEKLLLANMTANSQIVLEEKTDVLLLSQGACFGRRLDG